MKNKLSSFFYMLVMLAAFVYIGWRAASLSLGWTNSFLEVLVIFISVVLVYIFHIIIHEAGHLVAGLMTGYKFVSFRVGPIVLIKNMEGKFKFKRMTVLGTGGQCLMCPPDVPTEKCPYKLYHLMGGLANIIVGFVSLILAIALPKGLLNFCLLETSAVLGFMTGITNLVPSKNNGIQNDGYNLIDLGKNQFAKKSLNLVLTLNALLTVADSYDDLPKDLVDEVMTIDFEKEDLSNASIANAYNYQAAFFYAKGDYEKYYEINKHISENNSILEIFRNEAKCECLFYEIISGASSETIDARYDKNLQKYIHATSIYPSKGNDLCIHITNFTKRMKKNLWSA